MENIMSTTFEDGSSLSLGYRDQGGFQISYNSPENEETKLITLSEEIDYNLAKDVYFLVAKTFAEAEEEYEEDEEDEEEE